MDKEKEQPVLPERKTIEIKVRKNGLQLKKEGEEEEKEMMEREKYWETPAFLRRKIFLNEEKS